MITAVQLKVLREMRGTNVMTTLQGGASFKNKSFPVYIQTIKVLKKAGFIEDISVPDWRWRGSEYKITEVGREIASLLVVCKTNERRAVPHGTEHNEQTT